MTSSFDNRCVRVYRAEVSRCYEQLQAGKEFMKEVALSGTLIHKQAFGGSYMSFVSLSTEKERGLRRQRPVTSALRLATCGPKMEKQNRRQDFIDFNTSKLHSVVSVVFWGFLSLFPAALLFHR